MPAIYTECWRRAMQRHARERRRDRAPPRHRPRAARRSSRDEIGDTGVDVLRALKRALDPDDLLNPGVLVPASGALRA